jgi:hypothetical protein
VPVMPSPVSAWSQAGSRFCHPVTPQMQTLHINMTPLESVWDGVIETQAESKMG